MNSADDTNDPSKEDSPANNHENLNSPLSRGPPPQLARPCMTTELRLSLVMLDMPRSQTSSSVRPENSAPDLQKCPNPGHQQLTLESLDNSGAPHCPLTRRVVEGKWMVPNRGAMPYRGCMLVLLDIYLYLSWHWTSPFRYASVCCLMPRC